MTPERWKQIEGVFDAAVELAPAERDAYLAEACGGDAELRLVVRDPARVVWLDGQRNTRRAPNENLARELMELFTLGIGAYTEADVKEGARALTGWTVDRSTGAATFVPRRHDAWTERQPRSARARTT